jgi:Adenylate kinase and related kinases
VLAAAQSTGYAFLFKQSNGLTNVNAGRLLIIVITLTGGTTLLMWMGEQITKRGIGNGISLLIFASILAYAPTGISGWINGGTSARLFFPLVALGIVVAVVFVMEGQRRIPIQYARRQLGNRQTTGGCDLHAAQRRHGRRHPDHLRAAILALPQTIGSFKPTWNNWLQVNFGFTSWKYLLFEALLIIVMTYFYTSVVFNPVEQADNLRKYNGYIPGHPARAADRGLLRPRSEPADVPGRTLPRRHCRCAVDPHRAVPFPAGDLPRPRRHLCPHRRRRRTPDHAANGVADGHAPLRRVPTLNILVLGPQGSGKGTQAKRIKAMYGIPHIASGDMIREMKELPTELGRELKAVYDRGDLVSDDLMIRLIRDRLSRGDTVGGFILDGFPRTLPQAEALDELFRELGRKIDVVLDFQVADHDVLLQRMLRRAAEENRSDDTPEAIRRRLELYERETAPLIDYYRSHQANVVGIHADRTIEEVFREIADALDEVQRHSKVEA